MSITDHRVIYEHELLNSKHTDALIHTTRTNLLKYFEAVYTEQDSSAKARFSHVCNIFLSSFVRADVLAEKYQFHYKTGSLLVYFLAATAILCAAAENLFKAVPHEAILIEIISIAGIIFILIYGNAIGWHRRWLDYRFLAERLRCALFMAFAGEEVSSGFSRHDLYHANENDHWAFSYMRRIWNQWEKSGESQQDNIESLEQLKLFLRTAWLEDQRGYQKGNIARQMKKHHRLSLTGEILFLLTFAAAIAHYFHLGGHMFSPALTFASIGLPALGAAFSGLRAHFEHNKLSRRSQQMAKYLAVLENRLAAANDSKTLLQVLHEAEALMLSENAEWHAVVGYHELQKPA